MSAIISYSLMGKNPDVLSEVGALTGVFAATLLAALRKQSPEATAPAPSASEAPLEPPDAATAARLRQIEARLEEHAARLAEMPSTQQVVAAMEQLIAKMINGLDDRFAAQTRSIESLQSTDAQTGRLLERVLESLEAHQSSEPLQLAADTAEHPAD